MKYSLQKKLIVKENSDFQKIYRCGRSLANKNMVMYYCTLLTKWLLLLVRNLEMLLLEIA